MDARRVLVLASHLPGSALIWGHNGWDLQTELLTQVVEMLDVVRIQVAALTGDKKVKRWKPVRLPRPESISPQKKNTWVDFARMLARQVGGE